MSRFRPRLTYANVMATIAVLMGLGGGAYAATMLPANSVGPKQLRSQAVTPAKVSSATIRMFKGQRGTPGPKGDKGSDGAQGPKGSDGAQGPKGDPCLPSEPACVGPKGQPGASGSGLTSIDYSESPDPGGSQTIVDQDGFVITATCSRSNEGVVLSMSATNTTGEHADAVLDGGTSKYYLDGLYGLGSSSVPIMKIATNGGTTYTHSAHLGIYFRGIGPDNAGSRVYVRLSAFVEDAQGFPSPWSNAPVCSAYGDGADGT